MNEEIARILHLLEAGKVSADEAERLIRAIREPRAASSAQAEGKSEEEASAGFPPEFFPNPFRDIEKLFSSVAGVYRNLHTRQRRYDEFRRHEARRGERESRRQRAETQTVAERVRFVLFDRALLDPESAFGGLDEIARDLVRYELEEEFDLEIPRDDLETMTSADAVIAYIETRLPKPAQPRPAPSNPAGPKRPAKPAAARPRKPRSGSAEDMPAG